MGACSSKPKTTGFEEAIEFRGGKAQDLREDSSSVESICRNIPSFCCMQILLIETKAGAVNDMLVEREAGSGFSMERNGKDMGDRMDQPCNERNTSLAAETSQTEIVMKLISDTHNSRSQEEPRELHKEPGSVNIRTCAESNHCDGGTMGQGDDVLRVEVLLLEQQGTEYDVDKPVLHDGAEGHEVIGKLHLGHPRLENGVFSDTHMDPNFPTTLPGSIKEADLMQAQEACKGAAIGNDALQVHHAVQKPESFEHVEVSGSTTKPTTANLAHNTSTESALCSDIMRRPSKSLNYQERCFSNAEEKEPRNPSLRDPHMIFGATGDKCKTDVAWACQVDADASSAQRTLVSAPETDNSSKPSSYNGKSLDMDEILEKLASEFERQESLSSRSSHVLA